MTVLTQPLPFPDRRETPHTPLVTLDKPFQFFDEYAEGGLAKPYADGFAAGQRAAHIALTTAMSEQNSMIQEQLKQEAIIDHKTGLLNSRGFTEAYSMLRETGEPESAVIGFVDLDDFKLLNEELGHVVVDELLGSVARTMTAKIRGKADVIARLGGDEFAVILRDVDIRTAEKIIGRLNEAIENEHNITLSVGLAMDEPELPTRDVIWTANDRMKQAKEKHRELGGSHIVADDMPPEVALV